MEIVFGAKNGVRAFCDNSAESEPIWIKSGALSLWVKCRGLALADFGCDPRSRNSFRGRRDFVVFWSGTISPISRLTKFYDIWTQQRRSVRRWKLSEQKFENFTARSHFFKKKRKHCSQNFHVLRLQAAITPQWLTPEIHLTKVSLYWMSRFHFYR